MNQMGSSDRRWLDAVIESFEVAWETGPTPNIEQYVFEVTGRRRRKLLEELAITECQIRLQRGDSVSPERYLGEHPDLANELREIFGAAELHDTASRTNASTSASRRTNSHCPVEEEGDWEACDLGPSDRLPRRLADYDLLEELDRGGMGVVYKARQCSLDRVVAIKLMMPAGFPSANDIQRFRSEATAAGQLDHPNIVGIYEFGEASGQQYLAMEYVPGKDLAKVVKESPLPARQAANYVCKVATAVQYAHEQGVLHRDIKPSNVLIDERGEPRLGDFGLAKLAESDLALTQTGQPLGSPMYMSPEQAQGDRGQLGCWSDVYSLGATLYCLVTGRPPYSGATVQDVVNQVCDMEVEPIAPRRLNASIPRDLETICLKCLEKPPERRYPTAKDLAEDLQRFLNNQTIRARPVGTPERVWRWCHRSPVVAGLGAISVLLLLATIVAIVVGFRQTRSSLNRANLSLTDMCVSYGLAADALGHQAEAALWFANAAQKAQGIDTQRFKDNLVRVKALARQLPWPQSHLQCATDSLKSVVFHPRGEPFLLSTAWPAGAVVWDLRREKSLTLPGQIQSVSSAAWSDDGKFLAAGTRKGLVELVDFRKRTTEITIECSGTVRDLQFSPNGRFLAIVDDAVGVYFLSNGQLVRDLGETRTAVKGAFAASFSPRGDRLVVGCIDGSACVYAIQTEPAAISLQFRCEHHTVQRSSGVVPYAPIFVAHGAELLVGRQNRLALLSSDTGKLIEEFKLFAKDGMPVEPRFVVVSADRRYGVVGTGFEAQLWDLRKRCRLSRLHHRLEVVCAAFRGDGKELATGCWDGTVQLWTVPTPTSPEARQSDPSAECRHTAAIEFPGRGLQAVSFSVDGRRLAVAHANGAVQVWTVPQANSQMHPLPVNGNPILARLSGDGRWAFPTGSSFRGNVLTSVQVFDVRGESPPGPVLRPVGSTSSSNPVVLDAAMSPDGSTIVTACSLPDDRSAPWGRAHTRGRKGVIDFWNWRTGKRLSPSVDTASEPRSLDCSPDGKSLAVLCASGKVMLLNPSNGSTVREFQAPSNFYSSYFWFNQGAIRFAAKGRVLLVWGTEGEQFVYVFWAGSGDTVIPPLRLDGRCTSIDLLADGVSAAITSGPSVRIVNILTGEPIAEPLLHPDQVYRARFSRDGQLLATACRDWMARVWNWRTAQLVCPALEHENEVTDATFGCIDRWVITTSTDKTVRLWKIQTGKPLVAPLRLESVPFCVQVTGDGEYAIVSGAGPALHRLSLGALQQTNLRAGNLDNLLVWFELISGRRLYGQIGTQRMTADEWRMRWQRLRADDSWKPPNLSFRNQ